MMEDSRTDRITAAGHAPGGVPRGVLAASLTPLDQQGGIHPERFAAHVSDLLRRGCDGVALFGTTGEAASFTVDERTTALEALIGAGVDPGRLLVGTGCCALQDTVRLTRHAVRHGAAGVLMLPPFYYKTVTDDGLFTWFDRVVRQVADDRLAVVLYHFPKMSGVSLSAALIERLCAAHPGVFAGIKDSTGDWEHTAMLVEAFPDVDVFAGTERLLLDALQAGGAGCISATANVTAPLARAVADAQEGLAAADLQDRLTAVRRAIESFPVIPALKALMALLTGTDAWNTIRPPLTPLSQRDLRRLSDRLEGLGFTPMSMEFR